jgi:uncharacterized membrane protein
MRDSPSVTEYYSRNHPPRRFHKTLDEAFGYSGAAVYVSQPVPTNTRTFIGCILSAFLIGLLIGLIL